MAVDGVTDIVVSETIGIDDKDTAPAPAPVSISIVAFELVITVLDVQEDSNIFTEEVSCSRGYALTIAKRASGYCVDE